MKMAAHTDFQIVLDALTDFGLLLESDSKLPSVAGLIAGGPVRGSWWSHVHSQQIFLALQQLADHKDVLTTKLVSGKVTFVRRELWSELITIGRARETWQLYELSEGARLLLDQVDERGSLLTNELEWPKMLKAQKPGDAVRELEKRLLIHSEELHTASGAHAKQIETWENLAKRRRFKARRITVESAKRRLEERIETLNERFGAAANLPWIKTA